MATCENQQMSYLTGKVKSKSPPSKLFSKITWEEKEVGALMQA